MSAASAPGCYVGRRETTGATVTRPDGTPLELEPSLRIWRHSPTGFEWGYGGSGPAQLALALLLDHTGDPDTAERHYQDFKRQYVSTWRARVWALDPGELAAWLHTAHVEPPAAAVEPWRAAPLRCTRGC